MQSSAEFFAEFPPIPKTAWMERIAKDLKDKSLDDLYWRIGDGLLADPFAHADDFPAGLPAPGASAVAWELCETVDTTEPFAANLQVMEALQFGSEGLQFEVPVLDGSALKQVLAGVHLNYIGLHFSTPNWSAVPPAAVLALLDGLAKDQGLSGTDLRGSLAYSPVATHRLQDWHYLADLIRYVQEQFPHFQVIQVKAGAAESVVDDLAALLSQGNIYLTQLQNQGIAPADTAGQLQFEIPVGVSYFLEIAKLRALKLLWMNVLKGWGLPATAPYVNVRFRPEAYTDDLNTNMIRATTMAMSGVLGGAGRLTVLPYDAGREDKSAYPQVFARRIARNVQHLLKIESGFDQMPDPTAGSYYIEKLTRQIAAAAWRRFQEIC